MGGLLQQGRRAWRKNFIYYWVMNQIMKMPAVDLPLSSRHIEIVRRAKQSGFVTIEDLAEHLDVTSQTVRRDINYLCQQGLLTRFHGGAAYRSSIVNVPYETRRDSFSREKMLIARAVAAEINDETSVFIDIGTTAEAVATLLAKKRNMRVVTNNLNVVDIMRGSEGVEITVCGGAVRLSDKALSGNITADFIRQFNLDYSILGVVAISRSGDILDFALEDAPVTQAILNCARNAYIVADHSKFGRSAMVKVAHASQATAVITDRLPVDGDWRKSLSDSETRVIVATA